MSARRALGQRALRGRRSARGIVLFVSLALLLALSVGGLAAAMAVGLELRMARNDHDAAVAFHAAEAALADAEAWLDANPGDPAATFSAAGASGLYVAGGYGDAEPWRAPAWRQDRSRGLAVAVPGVAVAPRYVVEWLGSFVDTGPPGSARPPITIDLFRVTARASGASANASATLQSTYARQRGGGRGPLSGRWSFTDLGG